MSRYDLIAFDMDGTLLNSAKKLDPDTVTAIHEASRAGKTIALCTGRCVAELLSYLNELDCVRYLMTCSGGLVWDAKENVPVCSNELDPRILSEMLDLAQPNDQLIQLMTEEAIIQRDKYEAIGDYHMTQYYELYTQAGHFVPDLFDYYRDNRPVVYKCNLFMRNTEDRERMRERFAHLPLTMVYSEETGLECSPLGISKAVGLTQLCSRLGIDIARSICVGDADNDLESIRAAGLGIAMGNANENVIRAADVTVSDNDHGGCADAIYKYLLAE